MNISFDCKIKKKKSHLHKDFSYLVMFKKITCAEKACASLLVFLAILKLFISHDARIAPSSQLQTITKIHSKYAQVIF